MKILFYPTLLLALLGSMDCFTTVIGILYFGAVELNPLLTGVVNTNLPAFVILKLTTTAFVCLIFTQAKKILMQTKDKSSKGFSRTQTLLKISYVGIVAFLFTGVANNIVVLANGF